MGPAESMAELQQEYERSGGRPNGSNNGGYGRTGGNGPYGQNGGQSGGQTTSTAGGRYTGTVEMPSQRTRTYSNAGLSMQVPNNWREFSSSDQATFAPEGGYGDQGITHGVMLGVATANSRDGYEATQDYINSLLQSNTYLQQRGTIAQTTISGRSGNVVQLAGRSTVTGQTEVVTVYTTLLANGVLVYIATVVPQSESSQYQTAFRSMLNSVRLNA